MNHIEGIDRDQIQMLSLDQMVDRDSMARVIDAFVDMLDLSQFGFKYYSLNQEGRPPCVFRSIHATDFGVWVPLKKTLQY